MQTIKLVPCKDGLQGFHELVNTPILIYAIHEKVFPNPMIRFPPYQLLFSPLFTNLDIGIARSLSINLNAEI